MTDQIDIRTQDREIVEAILKTVLPPGSEVLCSDRAPRDGGSARPIWISQ